MLRIPSIPKRITSVKVSRKHRGRPVSSTTTQAIHNIERIVTEILPELRDLILQGRKQK